MSWRNFVVEAPSFERMTEAEAQNLRKRLVDEIGGSPARLAIFEELIDAVVEGDERRVCFIICSDHELAMAYVLRDMGNREACHVG